MSEQPSTPDTVDSEPAADPEISNLFEVLAGTSYENVENGDIWQLVGATGGANEANYSVKLVNKRGDVLIRSAKDFIRQIHSGEWKAQ
jgi:hypothetical protein